VDTFSVNTAMTARDL